MVFKSEYLKLERGVIRIKTVVDFRRRAPLEEVNRAVIGCCFKAGVSFG